MSAPLRRRATGPSSRTERAKLDGVDEGATKAWTAFMTGLRERLEEATSRGRTFHQETWVIQSTETLGYQHPALSGIDPAGGIQSAAGLGWTLENVSHVFIPTRERSRVLTDSAYVHGNVIGIYLFRRS